MLVGGVYGGYFGAAQGVILLALLGIFLDEDLQRVNADQERPGRGWSTPPRRCCSSRSRTSSWWAALFIAVGSTLGGLLGASIGRRLPPLALRVLIVLVGVVAIIKLL